MLVHITQLVNIIGSHSQSLLFFIVDTSYSCVICSKFWILCYEYCTRIAMVLVDWTLNFKIVSSSEDVQYEMYCTGFNYNIYTVALVKLYNYKIIVRIYLQLLYTRYSLVKLSTGVVCCYVLGFICLRAECYVMLFGDVLTPVWNCILEDNHNTGGIQ